MVGISAIQKLHCICMNSFQLRHTQRRTRPLIFWGVSAACDQAACGFKACMASILELNFEFGHYIVPALSCGLQWAQPHALKTSALVDQKSVFLHLGIFTICKLIDKYIYRWLFKLLHFIHHPLPPSNYIDWGK